MTPGRKTAFESLEDRRVLSTTTAVEEPSVVVVSSALEDTSELRNAHFVIVDGADSQLFEVATAWQDGKPVAKVSFKGAEVKAGVEQFSVALELRESNLGIARYDLTFTAVGDEFLSSYRRDRVAAAREELATPEDASRTLVHELLTRSAARKEAASSTSQHDLASSPFGEPALESRLLDEASTTAATAEYRTRDFLEDAEKRAAGAAAVLLADSYRNDARATDVTRTTKAEALRTEITGLASYGDLLWMGYGVNSRVQTVDVNRAGVKQYSAIYESGRLTLNSEVSVELGQPGVVDVAVTPLGVAMWTPTTAALGIDAGPTTSSAGTEDHSITLSNGVSGSYDYDPNVMGVANLPSWTTGGAPYDILMDGVVQFDLTPFTQYVTSAVVTLQPVAGPAFPGQTLAGTKQSAVVMDFDDWGDGKDNPPGEDPPYEWNAFPGIAEGQSVRTVSGEEAWTIAGNGSVFDPVEIDVAPQVREKLRRGDMDVNFLRASSSGAPVVAADIVAFELAVHDLDGYLASYDAKLIDSTDYLDRGDFNRDGVISAEDGSAFVTSHGFRIGDSDLDGVVDALMTVQQHMGNPGTYAECDYDFSGYVDGNDLAVWGDNYGLAPPDDILNTLSLRIYSPQEDWSNTEFAWYATSETGATGPILDVTQDADVAVTHFDATPAGNVRVHYNVLNDAVDEVSVAIYRSSDGIELTEQVGAATISDPGLLGTGVAYATPEIPVSIGNFYPDDTLLAVVTATVDGVAGGDSNPENDVRRFDGGSVKSYGTLYLLGSDRDDSFEVVGGSGTYVVNGTTSVSGISAIQAYLYGGDDHVFASTVDVFMTARGHAGNDLLIGGTNVAHLYGGDGEDILIGDALVDDLDWGNEGGAKDAIRVTTLADEDESVYSTSFGMGDVSLREAIALANVDADGDVIHFGQSLHGTIYLDPQLAQLHVTWDLVIAGPGKDLLAIDAQGDLVTNDNRRVLVNDANATTTLHGMTLTGGDVNTTGGGLYNHGTLTLDAVRLVDNHADSTGGGLKNDGGSLIVTNSEISGNTSLHAAGLSVFLNESGDIFRMENSTVHGNTAANGVGGGLTVNSTTDQAAMTITNSTISGNTSGTAGGLRLNNWANVVVVNSTITENTATSNHGGGIAGVDNSKLLLQNSIVANNTSPQSHKDLVTWSSQQWQADYSLFGTVGNTAIPTDPQSGNLTVGAGVPVGLAPLGDYGGTTLTHVPLPGSPAIDAASDAIVSALVADQRGYGFSRRQGGLVDIGATEATVVLSGNVATVYGTDRGDAITLTADGVVTDKIGGTLIPIDWQLASEIDVYGADGADTLVVDPLLGRGVRLYGGAGNDQLQGGAGDDTLVGGAGNDTYLFAGSQNLGVDTIDDTEGSNGLDFSALSGTGINLDLTSTTTLPVQNENNLFLGPLTGTAIAFVDGTAGADHITGNDLGVTIDGGAGNDILFGGSASDVLIGGLGDDDLAGGAGDDFYQYGGDGDLGTDTIFEAAGEGSDTLDFSRIENAGVALDLQLQNVQEAIPGGRLQFEALDAAFIENVIGTDSDDDVVGNALNNVLLGGDGDDTLAGGDGNDKLIGGDGDDALIGGAGDDHLQDGDGGSQVSGGSGSDDYQSLPPDPTRGPAIDDLEDVTVKARQSYAVRLIADDVETPRDQLRYELVSLTRNGGPDSISNYADSFRLDGDILRWQGASNADPGKTTEAQVVYEVTVKVIDGDLNEATTSLELTVENINFAPPDFLAESFGGSPATPFFDANSPEQFEIDNGTEDLPLTRYYNLVNGKWSADTGVRPPGPDNNEIGSVDSQTKNGDVSFEVADGSLPPGAVLKGQWLEWTVPAGIGGNDYSVVIKATDDGHYGGARSTYHRFVFRTTSTWDVDTPEINYTYTNFGGVATDDHVYTAVNTQVSNNVIYFGSSTEFDRFASSLAGNDDIVITASNPGHAAPGFSIDLSGASVGDFQYTPELNGEGIDTFTYSHFAPSLQFGESSQVLIDGGGTSSTGTVTIEVGKAVRADIDIDLPSHSPDAVQEPRSLWHTYDTSQETPANDNAYILRNHDDDDGDGVPDVDQVSGAVAGEDDLIPVRLGYWLREDAEITDYRASLQTTTYGGDSLIRAWTSPSKSQEIFISVFDDYVDSTRKGTEWMLEDLPEQIWIEGVDYGAANLDLIIIERSEHQESLFTNVVRDIGPSAATSDTNSVTINVFDFDLDIDSDNDEGLLHPDRNQWEEDLEDNPYGLGKLVYQAYGTDDANENAPDFTPFVIYAPGLNSSDPELGIRFAFNPSGDSGDIDVYSRPKGVMDQLLDANGNTINPPLPEIDNEDGPGYRVAANKTYELSDLEYDVSNGYLVLYISATSESTIYKTLADVEANGKPEDWITATLTRSGQELASDAVKYMVVQPDSFYSHLQFQQKVRAMLASRESYGDGDMLEFGMEKKNPRQMVVEDGLPQEVAGIMEDRRQDTGFKAEIYQDWTRPDEQYLFAFAGTDDVLDILEDMAQAAGIATEQYLDAMRIGDELARSRLADRMTMTGHSLGGGLASAASVVGISPALTFNAAGLSTATLYDLISGDERYVGSVNRLSGAGQFIDAYYMDWDLLSLVQDATPLPNAAGNRIQVDGPYDAALAWSTLKGSFLLGAGLGSGSIIFYEFAAWSAIDGFFLLVKSHSSATCLWGLLNTPDDNVSGYDLE